MGESTQSIIFRLPNSYSTFCNRAKPAEPVEEKVDVEEEEEEVEGTQDLYDDTEEEVKGNCYIISYQHCFVLLTN